MELEEQTDEPTALVPLEGPPPGTVLLDKYRVDFMLGVGGYGYVVGAHHLDLGEAVAIKILRDDRETDPQTLRRFQREAQLVVKLKSEHVARVLDVGKLPTGGPYMVMELLDGEDLGKVVEHGPLQITRAVDYVLQTCEALAEAHAMGVVHRDIKPGNLFLAKLPGRPPIIKVLDFGISKTSRTKQAGADMRLTQTQSILGTPAYMSPEQMRDARTVDTRSDIWSLGAVLYELVEGELPFNADNFAELVIAVSTDEPRRMMLAPELATIIARCLAKRVEDRYQTVAELAAALAPFATRETAREYLGRIHELLGLERPGDETFVRMTSREPPRRLPTPSPVPTEIVAALPPPTTIDPGPATTRDLPFRRFPWLAILLAAIVASATVIALVVILRNDPDPEPEHVRPIAAPDLTPVKAPNTDTKQSTAPDPSSKMSDAETRPDTGSAKPDTGSAKPDGSKPDSGSATPAKASTKIVVDHAPKPVKPSFTSPKPTPVPARAGAAPPTKSYDPTKYCPDGSLIASHMHGCPKR